MASVPDQLLRDGVEALAQVLPRGYSVAPSNVSPLKGDPWISIRGKAKKNALCLVLARRRVEPRDLGTIAAHAAQTPHRALLVSPYLSPAIRERLRGFGVDYCDLAGNAHLAIGDIDLCVESSTGASPGKAGERGVRSLCGEMAGRVARALVDLRPPYALAELAEQARVESSCASRVIAFLGDAGMLQRRPRGKIEAVDWQEILRRWSLDAPLPSRGDAAPFLAGRGIADVLARLRPSGFLHALTGEMAFAQLASNQTPPTLVMYVDDPAAALVQFGLHATEGSAHEDGANVVLVKPADRSVFHRSYENDGLRFVSPSLMAADLADEQTLDRAIAWMAAHETAWRR
jgi:hypothetical protein